MEIHHAIVRTRTTDPRNFGATTISLFGPANPATDRKHSNPNKTADAQKKILHLINSQSLNGDRKCCWTLGPPGWARTDAQAQVQKFTQTQTQTTHLPTRRRTAGVGEKTWVRTAATNRFFSVHALLCCVGRTANVDENAYLRGRPVQAF